MLESRTWVCACLQPASRVQPLLEGNPSRGWEDFQTATCWRSVPCTPWTPCSCSWPQVIWISGRCSGLGCSCQRGRFSSSGTAQNGCGISHVSPALTCRWGCPLPCREEVFHSESQWDRDISCSFSASEVSMELLCLPGSPWAPCLLHGAGGMGCVRVLEESFSHSACNQQSVRKRRREITRNHTKTSSAFYDRHIWKQLLLSLIYWFSPLLAIVPLNSLFSLIWVIYCHGEAWFKAALWQCRKWEKMEGVLPSLTRLLCAYN